MWTTSASRPAIMARVPASIGVLYQTPRVRVRRTVYPSNRSSVGRDASYWEVTTVTSWPRRAKAPARARTWDSTPPACGWKNGVTWTIRTFPPGPVGPATRCARRSRLGLRPPQRRRHRLPPLEQVGRRQRADLDPPHRVAEARRDLGQERRVVEVGGGLDDGAGDLDRMLRLEDPAADEDPVDAEAPAERGVGGRGDAAGGEVHDGEPAELADLVHE